MRASLIVGGLFVAAGCLHFVQPQPYRKIVPPMLGHQAEIVVISGLAEIAGGVGLCLPQTRRAAGIGLVALLVAVWPAKPAARTINDTHEITHARVRPRASLMERCAGLR